MIMTDNGIMIRISLEQVSVYGRGAQGVRVIAVKDGAKVSAVSIIEPEPEMTEEISDPEVTTAEDPLEDAAAPESTSEKDDNTEI